MDFFKRSLQRNIQMFKRTIGKTEAVKDTEYDESYKSFLQQEKCANNFKKHSKQLIDTVNQLSTQLKYISEDLQEMYLEDNKSPNQELSKYSESIEKNCIVPFQETILKGVCETITNFLTEFKPLKEIHSNRKKIILDYEIRRDKVQTLANKQVQKNPLDLTKAKESLDLTRQELNDVTETAKQSFNEMYSKRVQVYDQALKNLTEGFTNFSSFVFSGTKEFKNIQKSKIIEKTHFNIKSSSSSPTLKKKKTLPQQPQQPNNQPPQEIQQQQQQFDEDIYNYPDEQFETPPQQFQPELNEKPPMIPKRRVPQKKQQIPKEFNTDWYYLDDDVQQIGPKTFTQVKELFQNGTITKETHVFGGDLEDWKQLSEYSKMLQYL